MTGLEKKLSEGKRMPKKQVMKVVGATPETTFTDFAGKLRDAVGPLSGRKITEPIPLNQVDPALKKALKLTSPTPYTTIVKKSWGQK
uniref:Uncharacterized protein n=1 Tax=viral metagenome TaxID=1070528 RepID=A0A6C0J2E6_9ZZZZ